MIRFLFLFYVYIMENLVNLSPKTGAIMNNIKPAKSLYIKTNLF